MKKLLFSIFCLLLLGYISSTSARMNIMIIGGQTPAAGASCSGNYGDTSAGGSAIANDTDEILICRFTLGCSGTISQIAFYTRYFNITGGEFATYNDNGSGTDPSTYRAEYGNVTSASELNWLTDTSVSEVISGDPAYIWVAIRGDATGQQLRYSTGSTICRNYTGYSGSSFPDPWPTGSDSAVEDKLFSFYITF